MNRKASDSIIVVAFLPAWNEAEHLSRVLKSMVSQTLPYSEIVVIDDASEDASAEIAESFGVSVIRLTEKHSCLTGKRQLCAVYNRFFDYLDEKKLWCDYFMQHGADTVLPLGYNEGMLRRMESNPKLVIASGQIRGEPMVKNHARGSGRYYKMWFWKRYVKRYPPVYIWEDYAVYKALSLGCEVTNFPEFQMEHLRPTYDDLHQYGWAMRELGYKPTYALLQCIATWKRGRKRTALQMLTGYLTSPNGCYDEGIKNFLRRKQPSVRDYLKRPLNRARTVRRRLRSSIRSFLSRGLKVAFGEDRVMVIAAAIRDQTIRERVLYRLRHGHPRWVDYPTTIQLDTHNFCNLACQYCSPQGSFKLEHGWMPMETIEYVLKYFHDRRIWVDVVAPFMNGDSLLETRMPQITALAAKYQPQARVDVFTNGVAYENRHLVIDPNIDQIRFTISAVSEEMYERIHGRPYFNHVLETLKWTTEHKLAHQKIILNYILTEANVNELAEWRRRFSEYEQDVRPLHVGLGQDTAFEAQGSLSWEAMVALTGNLDLQRGLLSEGRPCPCWHNLSINWDGHILQCPDVSPTLYDFGKATETDLLQFWRKRFQVGLDNKTCAACNQRMPYWRSDFEKYRRSSLLSRLEALKLGY